MKSTSEDVEQPSTYQPCQPLLKQPLAITSNKSTPSLRFTGCFALPGKYSEVNSREFSIFPVLLPTHRNPVTQTNQLIRAQIIAFLQTAPVPIYPPLHCNLTERPDDTTTLL